MIVVAVASSQAHLLLVSSSVGSSSEIPSVWDVGAPRRTGGDCVSVNEPVGIAVKIRAAALSADHVAKEVATSSTGFNNLTQNKLAADRGNKTFPDVFRVADSAICRLVVPVDAARGAGIEVDVRDNPGEDLVDTMILLGLMRLRLYDSEPVARKPTSRSWCLTRVNSGFGHGARLLEDWQKNRATSWNRAGRVSRSGEINQPIRTERFGYRPRNAA